MGRRLRRRGAGAADSAPALASDACELLHARQELATVEGELAAAEGEFQRADLARSEVGRREQAAKRQAEEQRHAEAFKRARVLQGEREAAARKVDKGAKMLAEALHDLDAVCEQQRMALVEADQAKDSVRLLPFPLAVEAAIAYALRQAKAPLGLIRFDGPVIGREAPFAESDVRPVEPAEAKR